MTKHVLKRPPDRGNHEAELHEHKTGKYTELAALDSEAAAVPGRVTPSNAPIALVRAELEAGRRRGNPTPSWFGLRARLMAAGMAEAEAAEHARELRAELAGP